MSGPQQAPADGDVPDLPGHDLPGLHWHSDLQHMDWQALAAMYQAAPLGSKQPAELAIAFANSRYRWWVTDAQGRCVGAGRVLSDGVDCAYLCDVAVLPEYQGTGLGRALVARLVAQSRGHKKIILYAVPGKEGFYHRFGFRRMRTAMAIFADPVAAFERGHTDEV